MGRRYRVGYKFTRSKAGVCNGNFLGLGADACQTAVLVEHSAPFGLLITNGGTVLVRGCEFREDKPQIELGQRVRRAVITGNVFTGPARITNHSQGNVQIANNADEP